ncbi:phage tail fiber protein [Spirillospora sp. NBC_01491]|uniref:phage tail fiber protein n=1 Tax=Spirillospora sp. NBC_01491 TaxID=2976007 RepID=UPI002E34A8CF|nr:hypothetical protein [Spirillospora sp. NBC_01491]
MSNLTAATANALLDHLTGTATYTPDPPFKLALVTVLGSATSAGAEATGGGYARQTIAFTVATSGVTENTADLMFANMPAATIVGGEVYDDAGTRVAWGALTASVVCSGGEDLTIAAGSLTITIP